MSKQGLRELLFNAEVHFKNQNLSLAKAILLKVTSKDPKNPRALELLAYVLGNEGDLLEAVHLLERATSLADCAPSAHYELARLYMGQDNFDKADTLFEKAANKGLNLFELHHEHARSLANLGNYSGALKKFRLAEKLNPSNPGLNVNLGKIYESLGDPQMALEYFDKALKIEPDNFLAWVNKGALLVEKKQFNAAIDAYTRALKINPQDGEVWYYRGNALRNVKKFEEAIDSYASGLKVTPKLPFLYGAYVYTKLLICDWSNYSAQIVELDKGILRGEELIAPFAVLALIDDPELQKQAAKIWVNNQTQAIHKIENLPAYPRKEKIRIGYFSADFGYHPVSLLIAELFELHDRGKFEVFGFSIGPNTGDPMRKRMECAFDQFFDVEDKADIDIASLSRDLHIDIAIDLTGFTQDGRTGIFARRVAPVQVNFLGYPGTLGAAYMDYIVADKYIIPLQDQQFYSESIAYLPDVYQPNDRKRPRPTGPISRLEAGLPEQGFVFCCFNNNFKITPKVFSAWARVLKDVDSSVLWLLEDNPVASNNLKKELASRGVDPERLVFAPRVSLEAHLSRIRLADLFLDTAPYNAHTTSSDALWMGLPVLTYKGKSFASRVAASLIKAAGLPELVQDSEESYIQTAIDLAKNGEQLAVLRSRLMDKNYLSPLFDPILFTKNLESLYAQMYERSQLGELPLPIIEISK